MEKESSAVRYLESKLSALSARRLSPRDLEKLKSMGVIGAGGAPALGAVLIFRRWRKEGMDLNELAEITRLSVVTVRSLVGV